MPKNKSRTGSKGSIKSNVELRSDPEPTDQPGSAASQGDEKPEGADKTSLQSDNAASPNDTESEKTAAAEPQAATTAEKKGDSDAPPVLSEETKPGVVQNDSQSPAAKEPATPQTVEEDPPQHRKKRLYIICGILIAGIIFELIFITTFQSRMQNNGGMAQTDIVPPLK